MNAKDLLHEYKISKAAMSGPTEPFPTWAEWKKEYNEDREQFFITVDAKTAMEEADKLTEEAMSVYTPTPKPKKSKAKKPATKAKKAKKAKVVSKMSKRVKAAIIYSQMVHTDGVPSRKDVIARFVSELNMSQAGASTYAYNAKKDYNT